MGNENDDAGKGGKDRRSPQLPPQAVNTVGRVLKASYDQMLREPIPDKFMQLLEDLERSQQNNERSTDSEQDTDRKRDEPDPAAKGEE